MHRPLLGTMAGAPGDRIRPDEPSSRPLGRDLLLRELARDDAVVAFTGLRRRLGLHPETLTRRLRRLEEAGLVERAEEGYRLTEAGRTGMAGAAQAVEESMEVLRMVLPPEADEAALAEALSGRWVEALRWYGRSDGPGERLLIWTTRDGVVRVRIGAGAVTVEVGRLADAAAIGPLLVLLADALAGTV